MLDLCVSDQRQRFGSVGPAWRRSRGRSSTTGTEALMCCGSPTSRCRLRAPGRYGSGWSPRRSTSATGRPYAARRCTPDRAGCARRATLGSDIAGWVDTTGEGVTRFRPGDEVYGDNLALKGGFADYTVAAASVLTPKPAELNFAQASTIPQAGAIALQGTDGAAAGRRVLINGGGGSGSFARQLAKRLGAHVTGVDNAGKLDFMHFLGADEVIDYRSEDVTRRTPPYDLVLDLVAHRSVFAYRRALAPGGRYRCVGGSVRALLRILTVGGAAGRLTGRRIGVLAVKQGPAHFAALTLPLHTPLRSEALAKSASSTATAARPTGPARIRGTHRCLIDAGSR